MNASILLATAERALLDGHESSGVATLREIVLRFPNSEWQLQAEKRLADIDLAHHRFAKAIEVYQRLAHEHEGLWHYLGTSALEDARSQQFRFYAAWSLATFIALSCLWRLRRMRWTLPRDAWYWLPIAVLLSLAALTQPTGEAVAIITVAWGGLTFLIINIQSWQMHRPRSLWIEGLFVVTGTVGVLYCAVVFAGLWPKVVDTFSMGIE